MSDKTLLELAAKAAVLPDPLWCEAGYIVTWTPSTGNQRWDPLTDDGDALRLAVKLNLHLGLEDAVANAWSPRVSTTWSTESNGTDPYAATRRAIVRAAAEIGKSLSISPSEGAKRGMGE